jgi:hypothetical protein
VQVVRGGEMNLSSNHPTAQNLLRGGNVWSQMTQ